MVCTDPLAVEAVIPDRLAVFKVAPEEAKKVEYVFPASLHEKVLILNVPPELIVIPRVA